MICPFYGKNEDYCDVGCGYISPHDVETIIQFCSTHHEQCRTFQELMEFHPEIADEPVSLPPARDRMDRTGDTILRPLEGQATDQRVTSRNLREYGPPADKR